MKILCFLREILITATDNYAKKDELNDELYWLRYSFVDKDEDSFLLDEVSTIFFEFQTNPKYKELIKKIDSIKKNINKIIIKATILFINYPDNPEGSKLLNMHLPLFFFSFPSLFQSSVFLHYARSGFLQLF